LNASHTLKDVSKSEIRNNGGFVSAIRFSPFAARHGSPLCRAFYFSAGNHCV
jgi:hypothetical protein